MIDTLGYARISDKDQSLNSIDNQVTSITEYCTRNGLNLGRIFIDKGKSAFTFDRPSWKELEAEVKKLKTVSKIVVYHLDRFSRANLMDALIKINELETNLKVKVLSVTDPVDQNTGDMGFQIMRTISLLFSNNERDRIIKRTREGTFKSQMDGYWTIAMAPVGYVKVRDHNDRPTLAIDEDAARHVRKIFRLYLSGTPPEECRRIVAQDGFKLKGNSAMTRILTSHVYAGLINVGAWGGKPSRIVKGKHPAIVSEADFYAVQNRLNSKPLNRHANEEVFLRGVVRCHCGRLMTAGRSKGKLGKYYWYYLCKDHKKNYSGEKMQQQFKEMLATISTSPEIAAVVRDALVKEVKEKAAKKGGEIMRANSELEKLQRKIAGVEERYLLNPTSPKTYNRVMGELKADEKRLQDQIAVLSTSAEAQIQQIESITSRMVDVPKIFFASSIHNQHAFINEVFNHSLTYENGIYRTPCLSPAFADKALILKEKGLLEIQQPSDLGAKLPSVPGTGVEPVRALQPTGF